MTAYAHAVKKDFAPLVYGAEMKNNVRFGRTLVNKRKPVMKKFIGKNVAHNAGKGRFRRKWNKNFAVVILRLFGGFCNGIIPISV